MTDTERGLTELLEARRERIVTHTNVESVGTDEFRAFIDLALAADRRRQAEDEMRHREEKWTSDGWVEWRYREGVADKELRAALDALLAHLAGEGVES
jgi:hypothetical protein